ncbi:SIS domain-containing protein [Amycolatopsis rhizosphaerae]|uniref:SIS domain-containing protein n=1 Tax=Amycolatopsis rhizosphaerae TaxID=2053003 RepID=A0A558CTW8_9PSEU|nr:SIS domain-containing protein [Amycolatopsis rhizosphaerae]TVT52142.1 SIS domain-containing protein [Amycolatopsis rhizosphaerae]
MSATTGTPIPNVASAHLNTLDDTLEALRQQTARLTRWGRLLAERLRAGNRVLAAGNGGSAAEAQQLAAELVGRYHDERRPFSAIALHADTSSLMALGDEYCHDYAQVFARQVTAHARPRDIVVLLSANGRSRNLTLAAEAGIGAGATVWALTGPGPNPLTNVVDDAICLPGTAAAVQEAHLVAIHILCATLEQELRAN